MAGRRLLVLTYYYPPQPGSGSNRWAAMAKHLRRLGHEVTVITAAPPGHLPSADPDTVRTASLNASPLLRRVLLRGDRSTAQPSAAAGENRVAPPFLWRGIVPDPWLVTWNPYAWRALRRALRRHPVDCLITSSPAQSTHLLGLLLGPGRPPWVAEFRDGWCFERLHEPFPLALQRAADAALERRVARAADLAVGVTRPIAEDLAARLGATATHIPNGFDPEVEPAPELPPEVDRRRITLVHTGPLLRHRGDPRPLLLALRRVLDDDPALADRVQLLVAGRSEFDEAALLADAGLGDIVRHLGYLPRPQALALQRAARALILITSDARGEATGKLYEYLAAGRPIIALARGNEAARIVQETGTGTVVAPDDAEAIAVALRAGIAGELEYAPRGREPYTYPAPAEQIADAIEQVCSTRGRQVEGPSAR